MRLIGYTLAIIAIFCCSLFFTSLINGIPVAYAQATDPHPKTGHSKQNCTTVLADLTLPALAGTFKVNTVILSNFTATPVYILSNNGDTVVADGLPICNAVATCGTAQTPPLPLGQGTLRCATTAGSADVHMFGWR